MSDESEFWADHHEVLLHKRTREIYHVTKRFRDVDHDTPEYPEWARHYRLEDDTHTTREHWMEEDVTDCFQKIEGGMVVSGKPVQAEELRYWYD
jgi:hypothetical protein